MHLNDLTPRGQGRAGGLLRVAAQLRSTLVPEHKEHEEVVDAVGESRSYCSKVVVVVNVVEVWWK